MKNQHEVSNSVPSMAKQGAGHNAFATSKRWITASAVTRMSILKEQEKIGENRVQEHVEK